jgi:hypothetical protein
MTTEAETPVETVVPAEALPETQIEASPEEVKDFLSGSLQQPDALAAEAEDAPAPEPVDPWTLQHPVHGEVTVSLFERDLYLKAALRDEAITWPIVMPGNDNIIKVRSLTQFEEEAAERAAIHDKQKDEWLSINSTAARLQGYLVLMRVVEVGGKSITPVKFDPDDLPTLDEGADRIVEAHNLRYLKTHGPRYQLMLSAVRLFDVKMGMCNSALGNASFW